MAEIDTSRGKKLIRFKVISHRLINKTHRSVSNPLVDQTKSSPNSAWKRKYTTALKKRHGHPAQDGMHFAEEVAFILLHEPINTSAKYKFYKFNF